MALLLIEPEVPVTVIVWVPTTVEEPAVTVTWTLPTPVIELGVTDDDARVTPRSDDPPDDVATDVLNDTSDVKLFMPNILTLMALVLPPWFSRKSGPTFMLNVGVVVGGLIFKSKREEVFIDGDVLVAVTLSHVFSWLAVLEAKVTVIVAGVPTDGIIEEAGE